MLTAGSTEVQAKRDPMSKEQRRMQKSFFTRLDRLCIENTYLNFFTFYSIPKNAEKSNTKMRVSLTEKFFYVILKKRCRKRGVWIVI